MGDLITLNCPSCGGKLEVNADANILNCKHCGTEHLVRHEGGNISLEAFARCPKCRRNDRVEKVTSILRSQAKDTPMAQSLTPPPRPNRTFTLDKTSKPNLPPKQETSPKPILPPKKHGNKLPFIFIIAIGSLSIALCGITISLIDADFRQDLLCCNMVNALPLIIGIVFLIIGLKLNKSQKEKNLEIEQEYLLSLQEWKTENKRKQEAWEVEKSLLLHGWEFQKTKMLQAWEEENEKIYHKWQSAMQQWERLYFCHRDDVVFIPGEGTFVAVEKMNDFLFGNR